MTRESAQGCQRRFESGGSHQEDFMIRKCCKCGKIIDKGDGTEGQWTSHTFCDPCYDEYVKEIDKYLEENTREKDETRNGDI